MLTLPILAPTHLLWPHQVRYVQAAQTLAQDLFDTLDDDLKPQVLLLALPLDSTQLARFLEPAAVELPAERFDRVLARGRELQLTSNWPVVLERDDMSQAMIRQRFEGLGVRKATQEVFDELDADSKYLHFAGWPALINEHFVLTVLRLQRKPYRTYPALKTGRYGLDGKPLANSLLTAAIYRFNEEGMKALSETEPGAGFFSRPRETDEVLRAAGKTFLDTPAYALGLSPNTAKLFATCNTISSLRYEGAEGVGKLILARRHHPNLEEVFALTCPTELTDYRAVRKLLEMTTPDVHLLADGESVYALGRVVGSYDASREDLFAINFVNHYAWELKHGGQVLMRCHYGLPSLPRTRLNRARFRRDLRRTFGLVDEANTELLWDVVVEASRQQSGTLLVITTEALAEADRLKLQCTLIEPVPLTPLITRLVTSIDGAVLLDPAGYCYSIGVILDGKASGHGDGARGARFNSAVRYVESSAYPCMAVVVSEDGMVDVMTKESLEEERKAKK
jgi:hypothetical protein